MFTRKLLLQRVSNHNNTTISNEIFQTIQQIILMKIINTSFTWMDIGAQRSKLKLKTPHKRWWIKNASSKETWQIEGSKDKEIVNIIMQCPSLLDLSYAFLMFQPKYNSKKFFLWPCGPVLCSPPSDCNERWEECQEFVRRYHNCQPWAQTWEL